ncbi:MAG: YezD family protein [Clostridia bacterium]|nr:YezD family protein [Clostridia bacterium]
MAQKEETFKQKEPFSQEEIKKLCELAASMRFGSITLVFQDGRLIQIEKNEKMRLI